jgi:acyl-CoA dehydrogenase family protein 9
VCEELATACGSTAVFAGSHTSIGAKALVLYGTKEQKEKFLPKCASGEWVACYALTEPEAGSDAQNLRTTAVPAGDGRHYILNGSKHWITNAAWAHVFTVFARIEQEEPVGRPDRGAGGGIACFILTRDMPGLSVGKNEDKLGLKGSATNPLTFENVRVPLENMVGEKGQGFKIALNVLNYGRMSLGAGCLGAVRRMISEAALHATQRRQFDRPIAEFEMIQEKLWRMTVGAYVLESVVYLTAGLCDRGVEDFQLEAAVCKTYGTEVLWDAINDAVQIAGGNGFMQDYPYERFLRDARINMIFEGTNEIQRIFIALMGLRGLGRHLKDVSAALRSPLAGAGTLARYAGDKLACALGRVRAKRVHPALREEAELLGEYTDVLARKSEAVLRWYGAEISEHELIQGRLADMLMDMYCLAAVLSRATRSLEHKGEAGAQEEETLLVKTFAREARQRLLRNAASIDENDDALRVGVARRTLEETNYPWRLVP